MINEITKIQKFFSLRNRQLLIIVGISFIILSVSALAFFINDRINIKARVEQGLINKTKILSLHSAFALSNSDYSLAQKVLDISNNDPTVLQASLFDADKILFASYVKKGFSTTYLETFPELGVSFDFGVATVLQPIYFNNILQGWLLARYDTNTPLYSLTSNYAGIIIVITVLGLLSAWFMSSISHRFITDPIIRLADLVNRITAGKNYNERMYANRQDEIGILINGLNNMLDVIQSRESALQQHGEQLESLVELRTKQLHHRANYDSLTRLPNRYLLMEKINEAIENARQHNCYTALLLIDLDRFKIINDSLGHHMGDELLRHFAKRLADMSGANDCVGRLGGDEFVVLLSTIETQQHAELMAKRVLDELSNPFELEGQSLHISASIGISFFPDDADDAVSLLKRADISMYRSKAYGKGNYGFYDSALDGLEERLTLESRLREAIIKNEFHLAFQPQFDIRDNTVVGVEALLRWDNPEHGVIDPTVFVPIAEEMGYMNELSRWVIDGVCKQYNEWLSSGFDPIKIAVNISATDLLIPNFIENVQLSLIRNNMPPACLEIEITEEVFLENTEQIVKTLHGLKNIGVAIAIDDFGTGYSSLSYLQSFPVDILKLDGSFVKNISESKKSRGIVSSAISLAHGLGLRIVAECVDSREQLDFLADHGCDIVQGFYYSKPLKGNDLPDFVGTYQKQSIKSGLAS